jgi:IS30 family transposase
MKKLRHMQAPLSKTLTHDLGNERSEQEWLVQHLTLQVSFAIPHSLWQHVTDENTMSCYASTCPKGRIGWATNSVS